MKLIHIGQLFRPNEQNTNKAYCKEEKWKKLWFHEVLVVLVLYSAQWRCFIATSLCFFIFPHTVLSKYSLPKSSVTQSALREIVGEEHPNKLLFYAKVCLRSMKYDAPHKDTAVDSV